MAKKESKKSKVKKNEIPIQDNIVNPPEEIKEIPKNKHAKIFWVLGLLVFLIAAFFLSNYFFSRLNTFKYEGLTFTKEKFGEIPVYHYYYYITPQLKYNLYLRNDPRDSAVSLTGNAVSQGIEFSKQDSIYLTVSPEGLTQCEYGRAGIGTLASFLADNQLNVIGAASDEELAKEANVKYATCEFRPSEKVILLQAANKTEIIHEKENCYIINIANCEIFDAVEKFEVQSILDAKTRRESR